VSTGDFLLLVTELSRVIDTAALAGALASQPDVHGNTQHGWNHLTLRADGVHGSLSSVNDGSADVSCPVVEPGARHYPER
jgi:hypothetical protein